MRRSSWPTLDRYTAPVRTWIWIMHDSFPSCPCSSFSRARSRAVLSSMNFRRHSDAPSSKSRQNCMSAYPRMVFIVVLIVSRPHCIIFPPHPSAPSPPWAPSLFFSCSCHGHAICTCCAVVDVVPRPHLPVLHARILYALPHSRSQTPVLPTDNRPCSSPYPHPCPIPSHPHFALVSESLYVYLFPSDAPRARSTVVFCVGP
ncbi:hypothetical protein OH76DRAFT_994526 [Lentinus brumalis]|uniref:Uncharacterized protein n=1 Tax=Lentinus brumalis TaxID=2498619 RepID=A0A371DQF7_9APHY|nr:hypothetical protein OH76DRAFT_994526 [Polyporus brumalis]